MVERRTHDGLPPAELRDAWTTLVAEDPDATIFHTPSFLEVWLIELGGRVVPRVHTFHDDAGALVGVVAEQLERVGSATGPQRVLRFLGGTEVCDYLGPVARPEDRDAVAAAWVSSLASGREWDEVEAAGLAEDTGWPERIRREAGAAGLTVVGDEVEDVCPRVDLRGGPDAYLDRLSSKQRSEIKRKARKLAREAGELRVAEVEPDELQRGLDTFFAMAASAEGAKGRFFVEERMRGFFGALADRFGPDRTLRLHTLEAAGQVAAATVSLVNGGEWGLYNSAFDQVLRGLAPGMVLVGELLSLAAEEDLEVFDLLRGDEAYKYRFGADDRPLRRLTLVRG